VSINPQQPFDVNIAAEPNIEVDKKQPVWLSEKRFQEKILERRPDVVQLSQTANIYFNKNNLMRRDRHSPRKKMLSV
jgi:hypothetical protein